MEDLFSSIIKYLPLLIPILVPPGIIFSVNAAREAVHARQTQAMLEILNMIPVILTAK